MTLEDVIKAGKAEKKAKADVEEFKKDPYTDPLAALVDPERLQEMGVDPNLTDRLTPAQNYKFLNEEYKSAVRDFANKVSAEYSAVSRKVAESEDGLEAVANMVAGLPARNYAGVDDEVYKAHEKAAKLIKKLNEEPDKLQKEIVDEHMKTIEGRVAVYMAQRIEGLGKRMVGAYVEKAIAKIAEALRDPNGAVNYLAGLYNNTPDEEKGNVAYKLGLALPD